MKRKLKLLAGRYLAALRKHLKAGPGASLQPALRLGRQSVALRMETLDLARMHEQAVAALELSLGHDGIGKRAEVFFAETLTPVVETHRAARQSKTDLHRMNKTLNRRTFELAATNRQLQRGIIRRKSAEAALKKSGEHYARLLKESLQLQDNLRQLTYKVLASQEKQRKKISLELQNEIAQTLLGMNVRLLALKREAKVNTKELQNEIANTRQLVAKSAHAVRHTADGLRNA